MVLACNCVCSNCKYPLVAKNNEVNIKEAHFAHYSVKECEGAIETTLHLLAKSILLKNKQLTLPNYYYDYNINNIKSLFRESENLTFEKIILEESIYINGEKIIPDAIGELHGKRIFIEFANTHFVDPGKKEKIKTLGIACVEINLREQLLDEGSLTNFLNSNPSSRYWIINPMLDEKYKEHQRQQKKEKKFLREQEAIEKENRKKEAEGKYNLYKNNTNCRLFKVEDARKSCPLKKVELNNLKESNFYDNALDRDNVLKRIIDGEFWNREIYGYRPNGRFIYVGQEKIKLYPPYNKFKDLSEKEKKQMDFIFAGLSKIKSTSQNPAFGDCSNVSHRLSTCCDKR